MEAFDIHFNDKYRWDWEGPFDIPGDGYFDVTFIANGYSEKEMKGREEVLHEICKDNGGEYLPELANHLYLSWPTVFFAAHPRVRPPAPPNVFTETLGERGYMYILDELMFPTSWLTEVYTKTLELCEKHDLASLPKHPVFDGYPMRRQVISSQYWVYINDGKPKWVDKFHRTRDDFRTWFGERGGVFQTKFPPIVPDYTWTNQPGTFNLLRSIKRTLDPNNILSPGTFELGGGQMKGHKRTFFKEFLDTWSICGTECGACYYHGPTTPHNWLELPPHKWGPPSRKCPSFDYFKFKAYSAVGRGDLASIVHDNKDFPVTDDLMEVIYTCTGCGMCSEICYKLRPLTAILAIREELLERGGRLPEPLVRIDRNIEKSGNIFAAKKPPAILEQTPLRGKDLYFAGCIARFQRPEVVRATVSLLQAAGIDVAYLGEHETCCGLVPGHDGNTAVLERTAALNMETFREAGVKRIIVSCAHCYKTLKVDYRLIFGDLPFQIVHVVELLSQMLDQQRITHSGKPPALPEDSRSLTFSGL